MKSALWKSALKVGVATAVYAGVHSLLATRAAKSAANKLFGSSRRAAFYRGFYNIQSAAALGALYLYVRKLPDLTLYEVRGPAARLMNAGQIASLAFAVWAAREVGTKEILGVREVQDLAKQHGEILPEPEAQGPAPESHEQMRVTGPFRWSRHPLNFAPLPIFWLMPKMTVRLMAFNLVATPYMLLGSLHEEHRLKKAYGDKYEAYKNSGVPFFFPRPNHRSA